jgi:hypothetical protein
MAVLDFGWKQKSGSCTEEGGDGGGFGHAMEGKWRGQLHDWWARRMASFPYAYRSCFLRN